MYHNLVHSFGGNLQLCQTQGTEYTISQIFHRSHFCTRDDDKHIPHAAVCQVPGLAADALCELHSCFSCAVRSISQIPKFSAEKFWQFRNFHYLCSRNNNEVGKMSFVMQLRGYSPRTPHKTSWSGETPDTPVRETPTPPMVQAYSAFTNRSKI